ncbi:MAG: xanthine dehydrogenase family protein molybdopterin-binding subunit [Anaerolineae bacterium]|nr:xanthine dehydrogenase family protein molybdopterin-binding subunit [Anaerolineales bacterium]MCQ3975435.1 xanthine dehydrogenase family protein molybdopterin-binding subunit [Anaerolineae bacterium]
METPSSLTRRQFLKGSLGASLLLSFHLAGCQSSSLLSSEQFDGTFQPNVFLRIDPDNTVTITIPRSEMGQGVRTSLAMILAEELDADWSQVRVEQARAGHEYGDQTTGGSTSISSFWQPLREAGALARAMLITAAAQKWGVDPQTCATEKGAVIHKDNGQQLFYGELIGLATQLPMPDLASLSLKDPKDFRIIGTPTELVDNSQFVDGSAIFGLDVKVPNMLYAAIARCPVFGGTLINFEASATKAVEGVRDVVEIDNAVAVVAENTWAALQGREALQVTWDEGPNATLNSETIHQNILAQLPATVAKGSDNIQAPNTGKMEVLYEIPYLAHATMEPMNCVADVRLNHCEVWAPTQNPQFAQAIKQLPLERRVTRFISRALGLHGNPVTVNVTLMGGGFGRRLQVDYISEAIQVSHAVGQPVQVVWTREDDIQHDFYHPLSYHYVSSELDAMAEMKQQPYYGPAGVPTGAWRSVEHFTQAFVQECFVDELAAALGRDPYELRLERTQEPRLKAVLELVATKANWGAPLPEGWGRGIACYSTWGVTPTAEVVEVSVTEDGQIRVHRVVCVIDCGIVVNPDMVRAQVEGGIAFALSAALKGKITWENGRVQQSNFHDYPVLQIHEMPVVEVHIMPSSEPPSGVGEMSGPPLTPAVANAIFAATGKRIRRIPLQTEDLRKAG